MKRILTVCAGIVLAASLLTGCAQNRNQAEVTTAVAKSGKDLSSMVWQGTVKALNTIDVIASAGGRVTAIPVTVGQHVEKGDLILQLDQTDAALALAQANAQYAAAAAAFNTAKKAGEENTAVTPAQINYADAVKNFNRMKELYAASAVSQVDYETAKSKMDSAASQLQAARNGQDGNYDAAKAQLDSAKAALDIAQKHCDDCGITSPITGMVTTIHAAVGQTISPQASCAAVIDDSGEKVEIQVTDTDIDQLKTGMPMNIGLLSEGITLTGSISEIAPVCDSDTGMFTVKIMLDSNDAIPYTGLTADVRAAQSETTGSVYIPAKCIASDSDGSYVFTVSDGSASKTYVTTGKKKNAYMEVTDGLTQGSETVMQSSAALKDGMKVRVLTVK